jgi:hypothetical protein
MESVLIIACRNGLISKYQKQKSLKILFSTLQEPEDFKIKPGQNRVARWQTIC